MVVLVFGIVGYFLRSRGFPLAPMVLGILVGPIVDQSLRRAVITYGADFSVMFTRPVGMVLMAFLLVMLFLTLRKPKIAVDEAAEADSTEHEVPVGVDGAASETTTDPDDTEGSWPDSDDQAHDGDDRSDNS